MIKTKKISDRVWLINGGIEPTSNIYLINCDVPTLIDLGNTINIDLTVQGLKLLNKKPGDIKRVIYTHLHFDHIGRPSMFKNAKFYASEDEIVSFRFSPLKTLEAPDNVDLYLSELNGIKLLKLDSYVGPFEVVKTPGHTRGSICLHYPDDKVLFSGDTLFAGGGVGRTDLGNSLPKKMQESLNTLLAYEYKILCPGH